MSTKTLNRFFAFSLLAASLAACNAKPTPAGALPTSRPSSTTPTSSQPPQTETAIPSKTAAPTNTSAAPATGLCANPLAPVKLGATWTYRNTGGAVSPSTFTTTITDVRPDGFTVTTKFDDSASADQKWACKPEGLVALSLGTGQTALGLSLQGIKADVTTTNATDVTLPAKVQRGMKWPYGLDIAGSMSQGNLAADVNGSIATSFQAVGTESVKVPAGTFDAMKIVSASTFKVNANYHGLILPITSSIDTTFWFAPGVGWIKSAETGEVVGTAVNTVTELESYHIP